MEGNKSQPRAIFVFGAPCSGKTTFCQNFSQRFKAPHYNLADLMSEHKFTAKQIIVILNLLAQTGQNVVIEECLNTEDARINIRKIFTDAGYNTSLIWIQTDINTIKTRLKTKLKSVSKAKAAYDDRIKSLEAPSEEEAPIVLSGKHTFQTQLSHVLSQLA